MKNKKTIILYLLLVALAITSVAYAVLQTTLSINGTVTKKGNIWQVSFTNLSTPILTGSANVTNARLLSSSFSFDASLVKPLDSIVYTFDVVNSGTINAELDSLTLTGVAAAKDNNVTYTLTYNDGTTISRGDTLPVGQTEKLKLSVIYDNVSSISSTDVDLNLGATLIYVQSNS